MQAKHTQYIKACILTLGLDCPVTVKLMNGRTFKDRDAGVTCGLYEWNGSKHIIKTVLESNRGGWRELIAHEFAHAWIYENHPKAADHGRTFQRTAAALRRALRDWGYNVGPLYRKGIDV